MREVLLDRNENRYGPAPGCHQALASCSAELLFEYPREFKRGRYSLLSKRLADIHHVDESRVVLGYGSEDVLKQTFHCYVPSARVLLPAPSWWYYRELADEVGAISVEYPLRESATGWHYQVDELIESHRNNPVRMLIISTPNNPTGNSFPLDRLVETLEAFRDAIVVFDEAYHGYVEQPDCAKLTNTYPNLLVLRTFSKLYGLAGARVGYGVAGAGLTKLLRNSSRYLGYCRVTEKVALAALDDLAYYQNIRDNIAADRVRLYDTLRHHEGIRVYDSDANFVLARFPAEVVEPLRAGLEARGLLVKFLDEPGLSHCARITIGTQAETGWLCESLDELLPELLKRCA